MAKTRDQKPRKTAMMVKAEMKNRYRFNYYNLFCNTYRFNGLSPLQNRYILRRFWYDGKIAVFNPLKEVKDAQDNPLLAGIFTTGESLVFCPFAEVTFNIYDEPSTINLINKRGSKIIPETIQTVNEDVVIGYALNSKEPISRVVDRYLDRIIETEMTIWVNLNRQKLPLIGRIGEGRNVEQVTDVLSKILNDEPAFLTAIESDASITSIPDSPFIIDKLYTYKCDLENELLTFLGVDNLGQRQKKERLVTAEAESGDAIINDHSDVFLNNFKEMCDNIEKVLGIHIEPESIASPKASAIERMEIENEMMGESPKDESDNDKGGQA